MMGQYFRLVYIGFTVLRFGLDEVALSQFRQAWVRVVLRVARQPSLGQGVSYRGLARTMAWAVAAWAANGLMIYVLMRQLGGERQAEVVVHAAQDSQQPFNLLADLVRHYEAVCVVLRELPDAGEAGQHARSLVAVKRRLLVKADR